MAKKIEATFTDLEGNKTSLGIFTNELEAFAAIMDEYKNYCILLDGEGEENPAVLGKVRTDYNEISINDFGTWRYDEV